MTTAVYPGSFDPITNGHLDIATRAARIFQKVIIGVYSTPAKNIMFSPEERVQLIKESIAGHDNIEVRLFSGLTVDFLRDVGGQVLVRGLRVGADFEREFEMALMNKNLAPDSEMVCLMANLKYQFLSSSLLKEVASLGGYINDLVPPPVAEALQKRMHRLKEVHSK